MGKLIIISKDKKEYKMDIFLNEQKICCLNPLDEKYFKIKQKNYSIYCFSKHSQSKSSVEIIDLNKNAIVEVSQGFINPKINIFYLTDEELKTYDDKVFNNLEIENSNKNDATSSSYNIKKNVNSISSVGIIVLGLIIFFIGISLLINGNNIINNNSDETSKYSYTVKKQGINENGVYIISGEVTNNTSKDVDGLQIEFKCYDENQNYLDTISSYTENLAAGETWVYEVYTILNSEKISNCDFYQITPYVKIADFH